VEIMLVGSADNPAHSSTKAKFSTFDQPAKICLAALIYGSLPSVPSCENPAWIPISRTWSLQAFDNPLLYVRGLKGLALSLK